jgi:sugar/nucleoside kinase (ribokinase family)
VTPVRFIAVGELLLDVVVSGSGHEAAIRVRPGGSAANAAVWAASCGADATVVGALGEDLAGDAIRLALGRRGVRVRAAPAERTGTFVLLEDGGVRHVDRRSAAPDPVEGGLEAEAVLVSGYLAPVAIGSVLHAARGPWVALDAARLDDLPDSTCLFLGEERARALTGAGPERAARMLAAGRRLVCVTMGAAGAVGVLDGTLERVEPPRVVEGTALGAGDAFAAGALVALAGGAPLAEALAAGCRCGTLAAAAADGWPAG